MPEPVPTHSDAVISAVILAAGASRRMGQPKMLLPWGATNVIAQVVGTVLASGVISPVIVTGRSFQEVRNSLRGLPVRFTHNPEFESTEMLQSLQMGIPCLPGEAEACLVVLGDQPQIEGKVIAQVCQTFHAQATSLIIPSYQFKRGHPWLVQKNLWPELLAMPATATLRQFLNQHAAEIFYLNVESSSVLMDLDTPEEYTRQRPAPDDPKRQNEV
jgi:molybdenum cofactor cytidylyltransferase